MAKAKITRGEYLQLLGLLILARQNEEQSRRTIDAIGELIGEADPRSGHVGDTCYGLVGDVEMAAKGLMSRLGVQVEGGGQ
ncbi:MAG TPA: hypothetical protein VEA69_06055 [Tepidisphaeraceae bacterium]|nr:hypothetical protein [Tepidisphaeraceae bacterium]